MKKVDLTQGNIFKVMVSLAIPIMGSSFLQFAYNLIDMLWVGGLGSDAVAAIGTSSFFISLGYSISSMVVIGVGIKIAHAIGKNNDHEIKEYINIGILSMAILGIIYAIILIVFRKYLIGFFDLNNIVVSREATKYLAVSAIVLIFSCFNMMYSRVLNSFGNNKLALKISTTGIILNIILDPILIYVFKIGVTGAAIATLISQILMFLLFTFVKSSPFKYDFSTKISSEKLKLVFKLGLPMAMQRSLFTLVNIVLARVVSSFGTDAIAAQKIGLQVESITYMVIGGLNGAVGAYIGQNFGAKKYDRVDKGYDKALIVGMIYALITTLVFLLVPEQIVRLFVRQKETIQIAADYLRIVGLAQIFSAVEVISNGLFTGLGKPKIPSIVSMIFTALRIPMALIFIRIWGVNGIWISIAVSSMFKGVVSFLIYKLKVRKKLMTIKI
ncbi:MAG: MATE family efflux transporter [Sarcina sp.]